jgi:hypothetical protein
MNCCPKCTFRIYWNDDHVLYNCGHKLHSACLLTTQWSLINPTCSICNIGEIVKYKCSKNERLISRNKKNKKNNVIHCNDNKVEELDNDNEGNDNDNKGNDNEGNGNGKGDNEKRLIINQILCVFLIAFTVWKIISM